MDSTCETLVVGTVYPNIFRQIEKIRNEVEDPSSVTAAALLRNVWALL